MHKYNCAHGVLLHDENTTAIMLQIPKSINEYVL